jgi:hypothetical protein
MRSEVGGTSRSVFSAFADHLKTNAAFLGGMEVLNVSERRRLTWHNDLFEI